MKKIYCLILAFLFFNGFINAQSGFVSLGADVSANNASMSFSAGQVDYQSILYGLLTQGNQQPFEYYNASIEKSFVSSLQFSLFPNPVNNILNLDIKNPNDLEINYKITDVQGRLILENKYTTLNQNIHTSLWQAGMYFITFYNGNISVNTYKIIKQ